MFIFTIQEEILEAIQYTNGCNQLFVSGGGMGLREIEKIERIVSFFLLNMCICVSILKKLNHVNILTSQKLN